MLAKFAKNSLISLFSRFFTPEGGNMADKRRVS